MSESAEHSISTDPGDTLLFENDRVRVWSMTLSGQQSCDFHRHLHDHFILWPDPGKAEAQLLGDDGWTMTQEALSGYVAFKSVGGGLAPHRLRNLTDEPVTHYIVELVGQPNASEAEAPAVTNGRGATVVRSTGEQY